MKQKEIRLHLHSKCYRSLLTDAAACIQESNWWAFLKSLFPSLNNSDRCDNNGKYCSL